VSGVEEVDEIIRKALTFTDSFVNLFQCNPWNCSCGVVGNNNQTTKGITRK
jgi:hypothetical protein